MEKTKKREGRWGWTNENKKILIALRLTSSFKHRENRLNGWFIHEQALIDSSGLLP